MGSRFMVHGSLFAVHRSRLAAGVVVRLVGYYWLFWGGENGTYATHGTNGIRKARLLTANCKP
jgi:hypothetical protein